MNLNNTMLALSLVVSILCVFTMWYWRVLRHARLITGGLLKWSWFLGAGLFVALFLGGLLPMLRVLFDTLPDPVLRSVWEADADLKNCGWDKVTAYGTVSLSVGTALLATAAFLAFVVAKKNLDEMAFVRKAMFLLDLERQSTSPQMLQAQYALDSEQRQIHAAVTEEQPVLGGDAKENEIGERFHTVLQEYRKSPDAKEVKRYHVLMRNCDFFETIGVLVDKNYIDIDDVASRFEIGITRVHQCFYHHIAYRRKEIWASRKLFQHIESLHNKTKEYINGP